MGLIRVDRHLQPLRIIIVSRSQTHPNAVGASRLWIAPVENQVIAEKPLGAREPSKATTSRHIVRDANARSITRLAAAVGIARVVLTRGTLVTRARIWRVAAAERVGIDELAGSRTPVEVCAVWRVRHALGVLGARGNLEAAGLTGGARLSRCTAGEAQSRRDEDAVQHNVEVGGAELIDLSRILRRGYAFRGDEQPGGWIGGLYTLGMSDLATAESIISKVNHSPIYPAEDGVMCPY